jgi:hypothetical protein
MMLHQQTVTVYGCQPMQKREYI